MPQAIVSGDQLPSVIEKVVAETPILDIHTHLYSAAFGDLLLRGVDELVTYHYLIAEVLRADRNVTPAQFYAMPLQQRAEHIWQTLFLDRSPVSEAQRGVLTTLQAFGLDVASRDLAAYREFFASMSVDEHINRALELGGVSHVVMTNDPFDEAERPVWEGGFEADPRFLAALRIDGLLVFWEQNVTRLRSWGYDVEANLGGATCSEVQRFLADWAKQMNPVYLAVSLPDTFHFPGDSLCSRLIADSVLPFCRDSGTPFALMIGVRRQVNPALDLAGDGVGKFDMGTLEYLCANNPDVRFLVTLLSRENQHELCVAARKFPNLLPFGCWWFLNDPMTVDEMTRMRLELLGLSFIPQHSDARILDQLIYKWRHFRAILAQVLVEKYRDTLATGWQVTEAEIKRDVSLLLRDNFIQFAGIADRV